MRFDMADIEHFIRLIRNIEPDRRAYYREREKDTCDPVEIWIMEVECRSVCRQFAVKLADLINKDEPLLDKEAFIRACSSNAPYNPVHNGLPILPRKDE